MNDQDEGTDIDPGDNTTKIPGGELIELAISGAAGRYDVPLRVFAAIRTGDSIESELLGEYDEETPGRQLCLKIAELDRSEQCQHCLENWTKEMIRQNYRERVFECPFGLLSVGYRKRVRGNLHLVVFGGAWLELGGEGRLYQSFARLECDYLTRRELIDLAADRLPPLTLNDRANFLSRLTFVAEQVSAVVSGFYDGKFALVQNELVTLVREHSLPVYDMEALSSSFHNMLAEAAKMIYREQLSVLTALDPYDNFVRFLASSIEDVGPQKSIVLKGISVGAMAEWGQEEPREAARLVQEYLSSLREKHVSLVDRIKEQTKSAHVPEIENGTYAVLVVGAYTEPQSPRERWEHAVFGEDLEKELLKLVTGSLREIYRDQGFLQFVTRLTHTIRQPLNDISGNAWQVRQVLLTGRLPERTEDCSLRLRTIERTTGNIREQLDDLTRALRGGIPGTKLEIAFQEHALRDLVWKSVETIRAQGLERNIQIEIQKRKYQSKMGKWTLAKC